MRTDLTVTLEQDGGERVTISTRDSGTLGEIVEFSGEGGAGILVEAANLPKVIEALKQICDSEREG